MTTVTYTSTTQQPGCVVNPGQPMMTPVPAPYPNRGTSLGYAAKMSIWLGALQITMGSLSLVLQIIGICITAGMAFMGTGIWCGIFYIIAGAFGVSAGRTKSTCLIVTHMIMSIIAACFTVIHLTFTAIGAASDNNPYSYYYGYTAENRKGQFAVNLILVLLALAEGVIAIIASAISCHGLCCASPAPQSGSIVTNNPGGIPQVTYIQTPHGPQQVVVVTGPQAGMMGQPVQTTYQPTYPQQQFPQHPGQPPTHGPPQGQMPAYTTAYDPPAYQESAQQPAPPNYTSAQPAFNPDYKS